jgi:hypothetical protein
MQKYIAQLSMTSEKKPSGDKQVLTHTVIVKYKDNQDPDVFEFGSFKEALEKYRLILKD